MHASSCGFVELVWQVTIRAVLETRGQEHNERVLDELMQRPDLYTGVRMRLDDAYNAADESDYTSECF